MPALASLSSIQQDEAVRLYQSGLSAQQIADRFGVSIHATYYTLRKFNIPRRPANESNRIRFESKQLSFEIRTDLSPAEEELKLAAVMLYWAEGYKVGKQVTVDFANSNPYMAVIFRRFLSDICRIDEKRLRVHLYCYEGQNVAKLTRYWSQLLSIPVNQFTKPYIKHSSTSGSQGPRMIHGLAHICYSDKKLLRQILKWIEEYQLDLTNTRRW